MARDLNKLERLGVEAACSRVLGGRGIGLLLATLINANGRIVTYEILTREKASRHEAASPMGSLRTRMCWLREALADLGLTDQIVNHPSVGYSLRDPAAVLDRMIGEAT